jgi:delta1-piperideine-2-carboxylate reductase
MTLSEIRDLVARVFSKYGCDGANTQALVRTVVAAERDGSLSHGLFRVPGYVASLRSGQSERKGGPEGY